MNPKDPAQATAFLSCSIAQADKPIATAVRRLLEKRGFTCLTVGANWSAVGQPDDVMRELIGKSDCLVGIATARLSGSDLRNPNQTLKWATPYLLQETAMAHHALLPFVIFKVVDVELQGVTGRNIYVPIHDSLSASGKLRLAIDPSVAERVLSDLMRRAIEVRSRRANELLWSNARNGVLLLAGIAATAKVADILGRPECFGEFYYKKVECKDCEYKANCKIRKLELAE